MLRVPPAKKKLERESYLIMLVALFINWPDYHLKADGAGIKCRGIWVTYLTQLVQDPILLRVGLVILPKETSLLLA